MATTKVSELAALTTPDGAEELLINDGGTSKKITIANAIIAGTGITKSGATISASPVALTTVQTAANQTAHLALTAQEGDVVVRSDENKTYMHNGGSASNMNDYTLLATPTDAVTSVGGNTGVVTNAQIAASVEAASDSNTFTDADHSKLNAIEASADVTDATNVDAAGALMKSGGTMTGNISHAGALTLDVGSEINLDSDSGYVYLKDGGTSVGLFKLATSDFVIKSPVQDKDIIFQGNDGGSTITALTLDMSAAGDANFNRHAKFPDDGYLFLGGGEDLQIYHDHANQQNKMISASLPVILAGTTVSLNNGANNENMLVATQDGSVDLYHNHVKKFETTATGVTVTDRVTGSGDLILATVDSNEKIHMDSDGYIKLETAGTERMRIDSSGNIGMNTTSPSKTLSVHTTTGSAGTPNGLYLYNEVHGSDSQIYMYAENDSGSNKGATIKLDPDAETFSITGTGGQTAITIDDSGRTLIADLADNSIDSEHYVDGSIDTAHLSADCITNAKIANDAIDSEHYTDGSVDAQHISSEAVTTAKIAGGNVTTAKIADDAVTAAKLSNSLGDLSGNGISAIGLDGSDYIGWSNNAHTGFVVNGNEEMRIEADGDLHVDGDVIAYSTTISDERLKDNIEVVDGALDKVKELKGVTFTRKQDGVESAGVIAQDVEKVLPQAVKNKALPLHTGNDELFKTVQYDALHALLIEAVKELSEKVEKLENK